jgi:hypothetical protein
LRRGASRLGDLYEAGTARERAYIRSIKIDKLGSAVVEQLDDDEYPDFDEAVLANSLNIVEGIAPINLDTQEIFEWDLH